LAEVAEHEGTITYGELAPFAGFLSSTPYLGSRLSPFLRRIDKAEQRHGRPLLSALVVTKASGTPGAGFYALTAKLGLHPGGIDEAYWQRELNRTHAYHRDRA